MYSWLLLLALFILLGLSVYVRVVIYRTPKTKAAIDNIEMKSSPLSIAVQDLIATAGGIYLSLIMVVSFLKIEVPEKVLVGSLSVDPIALLAILLVIIQPFVIKIFIKNSG